MIYRRHNSTGFMRSLKGEQAELLHDLISDFGDVLVTNEIIRIYGADTITRVVEKFPEIVGDGGIVGSIRSYFDLDKFFTVDVHLLEDILANAGCEICFDKLVENFDFW